MERCRDEIERMKKYSPNWSAPRVELWSWKEMQEHCEIPEALD
jgi:hypothetical protein